MYIGNVEIKGYAALAPMAGVADRAFRELCRDFGAAYVVTEMVSAKGYTMGDRKSADIFQGLGGQMIGQPLGSFRPDTRKLCQLHGHCRNGFILTAHLRTDRPFREPYGS